MTSVGEQFEVDVLGHQLPLVVPVRLGRARVVGREHDRHRDRQRSSGGVQQVGEVAVRGDAVVPVRGAEVLGPLRVELSSV